MSALGLASLGVFCEDRALGMASLGVFCEGGIPQPQPKPVPSGDFAPWELEKPNRYRFRDLITHDLTARDWVRSGVARAQGLELSDSFSWSLRESLDLESGLQEAQGYTLRFEGELGIIDELKVRAGFATPNVLALRDAIEFTLDLDQGVSSGVAIQSGEAFVDRFTLGMTEALFLRTGKGRADAADDEDEEILLLSAMILWGLDE